MPGGRPHAETVALREAGARAAGATAYVTLEPCAHQGETAPCAEALAAANVARVVTAIADPDPRVAGRGHAMLRGAGVAVAEGVLAGEARTLNAGFFLRVAEGRPLFALKIAASIDGKIAAASGESKWITGEEARAYGHLLRARHDAILTGIGSVLADDPELTCRVPGLEDRKPLRAVLDSRLRIPRGCRLAKSAAGHPVVVFTTLAGTHAWLRDSGIETVRVRPDARGRPDIGEVAAELGKRGITRVLAEGGAGVHATLIDRGLADRLHLFRSGLVIGGGGRSAIDALAALGLSEAPRYRRAGVRSLGPDLVESFAATA